MATRALPRPTRPRPLRARSSLVALLVFALLLADVALGSARRALAGPPAAEMVPAAVSAYGDTGVLAVALTAQVLPREGLTGRALDARDLVLSRRTADNGAAADRPFPTASLVKLFLAEDVLHRARTGQLTLEPRDWRLLQTMISSSDDPSASEVWDRFGGPQMVRDVAARYGLSGTAPPADPTQWGEATTTARDLARFLALLPSVASPADATTLLVWMRTATPVAADGFDQRFGVLGAAPGRPAVKQGWMCCVGGNRHLHSVGVVGTRVVVLLSEVPRSVGYDRARAALTAAAAALPPPAG
jgi:hypothetical protein